MTTYLQRVFGMKSRGLICLVSMLATLALAPVSAAHAATGKARVAKTYDAKAQSAKSKKVVAKSRKVVATSKTAVTKSKKVVTARGKQRVVVASSRKRLPDRAPAVVVAAKPSFGQMAGLHAASDALNLKSSVALVVDQQTNEVLYSKNDNAVLPIASLTKLMTGLVVSEARLPMDQVIEITSEDVDTEKGSRSRLQVGSTLTRGELMHLALMSSENRAAHALARTAPGGMNAFVAQMNAKARMLGMAHTVYVEPTGLSSSNRSTAHDLVKLVNVAHQHPLLRDLTTSHGYEVEVGNRMLQFNNTNRLVKNPTWDIGLQKTGYISEAGRCLVMQASVAGRKLIMVFLDSAGKLSRLGDAERVRQWLETTDHAMSVKASAALAGG